MHEDAIRRKERELDEVKSQNQYNEDVVRMGSIKNLNTNTPAGSPGVSP